MTGMPSHFTVKNVMDKLRAMNITMRRTAHGEYRINFRGGAEATAYYTDNLEDVWHTAMAMDKQRGNTMHDNPSLILAGNPGVRELGNIVYDYATASAFLGEGRNKQKKLANNTIIYRSDDGAIPPVMGGDAARRGEHIAIKLHGTVIVRFYQDGAIRLNSGGYHTVTTKQRINQLISGTHFRVDQTRYVWTVRDTRSQEKHDFYDGMVLEAGMSLKSNPSRSGPLARGEIMSNRVYEVRYKHAEDGADYKHDFGAGVKMEAMPDGSIRLYHATLRLWGDF